MASTTVTACRQLSGRTASRLRFPSAEGGDNRTRGSGGSPVQITVRGRLAKPSAFVCASYLSFAPCAASPTGHPLSRSGDLLVGVARRIDTPRYALARPGARALEPIVSGNPIISSCKNLNFPQALRRKEIADASEPPSRVVRHGVLTQAVDVGGRPMPSPVASYSMGALPNNNNRRIFVPRWRLDVLCNQWGFRLAVSCIVALLLCIVVQVGMSLRHPSTPSCRVYDPAQGVGVLIDDAGRRLCRANG